MAKTALLIGVSEYADGLNPLPKAVDDIEAMKAVLEQPDLGGFEAVKVLPNPDSFQMQLEIEQLFSNRHKDDLVVLFFSGHGVKDESGNLHFATSITRKTADGELIKSTAVPSRFVHDIMSNSRSRRQVIILDCCFSGAFAKGLSAKDDGSVNIKDQLGGEGRVVLTSSAATQYSFEEADNDLSIYTRYLVEGMSSGAADDDNDGMISIGELHEYAKRKVHETSPAMKPKIYAVEEGFKIFLTQSPVLDPALLYRKEVERCASKGKISTIGRRILNELKDNLELSDQESADIEEAVFKPFREYESKLRTYQQVLQETMQRETPLSADAKEELRRYQKILGLRDKDVAPIKTQILPARVQNNALPGAPVNAEPIEQTSAQSQAFSQPSGRILNDVAGRDTSAEDTSVRDSVLANAEIKSTTAVGAVSSSVGSSSRGGSNAAVMTKPVSLLDSSPSNAASASSSNKSRKIVWIMAGAIAFGLLGGGALLKLHSNTVSVEPLAGDMVGEPVPTQGDEASEYVRPQQEQALGTKLANFRKELGLDLAFLNSLVDLSFHAQHPELNQRSLEVDKADETMRMEWLGLREDWLNLLDKQLSAKARSGLGKYDTDSLAKQSRDAGLAAGIALNDLADAKFYSLFGAQETDLVADPDLFLSSDPGSQLWQGIAADKLQQVSSSKILQKVPVGSEPFTSQGSLAVGDGKVFLLDVAENPKRLLVTVEATGTTQLSVYQPGFDTSLNDAKQLRDATQAIALDSENMSIAEDISETGVYTITLVSTDADPTNYTITIEVESVEAEPATTPDVPDDPVPGDSAS